MTPGLQRTTFNRSGLVRLLSEITPEPVDPKYDFGERLGQWLDFADALALFSALNAGAAPTAAPASDANASPLAAQLNRVRENLSSSIQNDGVFSEGTVRIRFPTPLPQATAKEAADFAPYHRYYLAHQRDMASAISALRVNARKALAARSPAHRQLAELDANFDKILIVRERNLLGNIPILLARRFAQRYQEHQASLPADAQDDPALWTQPGSWLEAFCQDTQAMLLAELDLRLKPATGLIAALGQEDNTTP
ncbi:DUF3348 domain-containing protein [Dechloromonas sp. ARDL1]|uniref:DUF3348 domain-containing protein n=1 Tax=Dechloromonas sp. ARDL1 TaxID=3322121 RepID=UPI003DA74AB0